MILVKRRLSIFHALRGATLWRQDYFKFMVHEKLRHILSEYTLIFSDIKPYLFLIVTYRLISGNIKSLFSNKAKKIKLKITHSKSSNYCRNVSLQIWFLESSRFWETPTLYDLQKFSDLQLWLILFGQIKNFVPFKKNSLKINFEI